MGAERLGIALSQHDTGSHSKTSSNYGRRAVQIFVFGTEKLQSLAKGFGNLEQQGVNRAYAIFNNCYQNFGIMNARTMAAILRGQESITRAGGSARITLNYFFSGPVSVLVD